MGKVKILILINIPVTHTYLRKLSHRCNIDFVNSPAMSIGQDIMFHLSVRRDENKLIRNSFINKRWGDEERYGKLSVKLGDPFEIVILAEMEFYKIAINGIHIGVFRHRLPMNLVQFINVSGDTTVSHILLEQDMQSAQQYPVGIGHVVGSVHAIPSYPMRYGSPGPAHIGTVTTSIAANPQLQVHYEQPPPYNPSAPPTNTWVRIYSCLSLS
jgi:galectin-9